MFGKELLTILKISKLQNCLHPRRSNPSPAATTSTFVSVDIVKVVPFRRTPSTITSIFLPTTRAPRASSPEVLRFHARHAVLPLSLVLSVGVVVHDFVLHDAPDDAQTRHLHEQHQEEEEPREVQLRERDAAPLLHQDLLVVRHARPDDKSKPRVDVPQDLQPHADAAALPHLRQEKQRPRHDAHDQVEGAHAHQVHTRVTTSAGRRRSAKKISHYTFW